MTECEICGKDVLMPFECNFCGRNFCEEHRLPENHDCAGAPARTPLGSYQSKQRLVTEGKSNRGMGSEGDFHFAKRNAQGRHYFRRRVRMRPWYWFLVFLFLFDFGMVFSGEYYMLVGDYGMGWQLLYWSIIPVAILLAIGALYFERWWRRHMRRFWGE
jgi:hypothetical protein